MHQFDVNLHLTSRLLLSDIPFFLCVYLQSLKYMEFIKEQRACIQSISSADNMLFHMLYKWTLHALSVTLNAACHHCCNYAIAIIPAILAAYAAACTTHTAIAISAAITLLPSMLSDEKPPRVTITWVMRTLITKILLP